MFHPKAAVSGEYYLSFGVESISQRRLKKWRQGWRGPQGGQRRGGSTTSPRMSFTFSMRVATLHGQSATNSRVMASKHNWRFFRAGGFDQVRLDTGSDLMALGELDQKLWVALACPTSGLEFDSKTLALIDTDKDGRIRPPELIAAVEWAGSCLKSSDELLKSSTSLPLSSINDTSPEGKQLLASAKQILANLGEKEASVITLEHTADTARIFAQTHFNGDGIVPADSAEDDATRAAINDVIGCLGSDLDRSGKPGINQAKLDHFFQEAQAFSDWWKKAETDPAILPLGPATISAGASFEAVRPKIDDYF